MRNEPRESNSNPVGHSAPCEVGHQSTHATHCACQSAHTRSHVPSGRFRRMDFFAITSILGPKTFADGSHLSPSPSADRLGFGWYRFQEFRLKIDDSMAQNPIPFVSQAAIFCAQSLLAFPWLFCSWIKGVNLICRNWRSNVCCVKCSYGIRTQSNRISDDVQNKY